MWLPRGPVINIVAHDDRIISGGTCKGATVSHVLLHIADDGSLRHGSQGQHVANGQSGLLSTVEELAGVHALGRDEQLLLVLESERVTESHLQKEKHFKNVSTFWFSALTGLERPPIRSNKPDYVLLVPDDIIIFTVPLFY